MMSDATSFSAAPVLSLRGVERHYKSGDRTLHVLRGVEGVAFVHLDKQDIVRHPLVKRIVKAYDISEGIADDEGAVE